MAMNLKSIIPFDGHQSHHHSRCPLLANEFLIKSRLVVGPFHGTMKDVKIDRDRALRSMGRISHRPSLTGFVGASERSCGQLRRRIRTGNAHAFA
jgi:hypothetical protein